MMLGILLKIIFVAAVTALAWFSVPVALVALSAVVLAAIYDKASSLIEISFGPLKAKLERDVTDAEKLLLSLRKLAQVQAKFAISTSARTGRWASEDGWNYDTVRSLEQALRDTGATDAELTDARTDFIHFTLRDYAYCILGGSYVPMHRGQEAVAEYHRHQKSGSFLDPEFLEQWLTKWSELTAERKVLLDDMRWLKSNGDVKDREQFMRSQQPIKWQPDQL
jgi:hypothetical protein